MNTTPDLLKAIRTGQLSEVIAALDAGAPIELDDGKGDPGLPWRSPASWDMRKSSANWPSGARKSNLSDNGTPTSPLSMAVRAGRTEVVKVLIEHGAVVPAGMNTGLRDDELMLARWKAQHFGARQSATAPHGEAVIEEIR